MTDADVAVFVGPRPDWHRRAACAGLPGEWFFARRDDHESDRRGREVCAGCPVRTDCLEWALGLGVDDGLWGGLSPHQRRAVRRLRRVAS